MDSSVKGVDFLGIESSNEFGQIFVDVILEDIVLELGGFFDIIVHFLENFKDKLKCLLVDVLDGNLNKIRVTLEPFSMASASSIYFMEATCC